MDVFTIKAEIKAWERSFKATNGRDPGIQDIKLLPDIAAKYKLYKKLSKEAAENTVASFHTSSDPPSTPPRSRPRAHHLVQPRNIETTAPLSSFNPFSPQKNKRVNGPPVKSQPNASASPFKPKAPSCDPFPAINLPKPSISSHTPSRSPPAASTAVSRARKRLRGEPVSPSPNKEKRRRIGSHLTLPFTKLGIPDSLSSDDEEGLEANSSFISDSPVKAPSGGKSFKLLFNETEDPQGVPAYGRSAVSRTKSSSLGLFGGDPGGHDDDATWDLGSKAKTTLFKPSPALPASGTIFTSKVKVLPGQVQPKKSVKRPLSDVEADNDDVPRQPPPTVSSLIPPSPPPAESSTNRQKQLSNARGKGKAEPSRRKKVKTAADNKMDDQEEESDDSDTLPANVKIVDRARARFDSYALPAAGDDSDPDPILGYSHRGAPRGHETQPSLESDEGRLDVSLPDKLRRVLALDSAEVKIRSLREERVVKGLVLGQRDGHYDPSKGGEIWDVGEDDARIDGEEDTWRDTEGEDDWEGEPVPWAVGEL